MLTTRKLAKREQIAIQINSSNPDDVMLDPSCGCGTGIDLSARGCNSFLLFMHHQIR